MNKKIAFIFPGQGAQYVGMGKDFYEAFPVALDIFERANKKLGFSLSKLMFEGPSEELILTKNSQIAIYVMSIAIWSVLKKHFPNLVPQITSGLSLGEYTALTVSGKLSFEDGIDLVRARGLYMHEASIDHPGTMAVVLGMDFKTIKKITDSIQEVWIANLNCPGQIVISGTLQGISQAAKKLKEQGAKRVLPLDVSGAFHSGLMSDAQEKLQKTIKDVHLFSTNISLVMNVTGDLVESTSAIYQNLIDQMIAPVYWEKGIKKMEELGIELFIEVGCGKTLSGMNRKIGIQGLTLSIDKVEDLEQLQQIEEVTDGIA